MLRIKPDDREQWEWQLDLPLPGEEETVTERSIEEEGAAFMAAMAQLTGG